MPQRYCNLEQTCLLSNKGKMRIEYIEPHKEISFVTPSYMYENTMQVQSRFTVRKEETFTCERQGESIGKKDSTLIVQVMISLLFFPILLPLN